VIFALARRAMIDYHRCVHRFAIVIVLSLATLSARADTPQKPTLVVRIENADGDSAKLALALEGALRVASKSHYVHKPTDKQIQAVADGTDCVLIEPTCAASFGSALAVDYVLAGAAETHGVRQLVVLSLVNVKTRQRVRSLRDVSTKGTATPTAWARAVLGRLVGDAGELTVIANAQRGDVLLDGQIVSALFDGKTTISGIALGGHQLGIRAKGYKPIDIDITVDGTSKEMLLLDPLP
jgi:hypothetical protein